MENSKLKDFLFKIPAGYIILITIVIPILVISLIAYTLFRGPASNASLYLTLVLIFLIISVNGASIMNRNGLDIAFLLLFGITLVFGPSIGLLTVLVTSLFSFYLAKAQTPIDFIIEKSPLIVWIQLMNMLLAVIVLWVIIAIFGTGYIYSNLLLSYMVVYAISRSLRMIMLVMFAQIPAIKVGVTNLVSFVINYYLAQLFALTYLAFLNSF